MAQGVPGSQNEHFFELLHPNPAQAIPPPPPPPPPPRPASGSSVSFSPSPSPSPSMNSTADGSPAVDHPPYPTITPSYDFQSTHAPSDISATVEEVRSPYYSIPSGDQHQGPSVDTSRGFVHGKPLDPIKAVDHLTMDAIDRTMKQYTDNILQVLDGVNGRLALLETKVQGLDATIAELKAAEGEKLDQSHGRLMKLELLMEEVHRGVQSLHENQRLDEAKSQLSKLHLSEQQSAGEIVPQTTAAEGWQQPKTANENLPHASFPESSSQPPPHSLSHYPSAVQSQYPHAPPPPQMQGFATSQGMLPLPSLSNPIHQPPFPPAGQHIPSQQQQSLQQAPLPQSQVSLQIPSFNAQSASQPSHPNSYNLPTDIATFGHMQITPHLPPPQVQPSNSYLPEPSHYAAGMHGGPQQLQTPQEAFHLSQHQNPSGPQHTYDSATGRMGSSIPQSYGQPPPPKPGLPPPATYETPSSGGYGGSPYRSLHPVPSAPSGGGAAYPRLPTAQPVQHGLPTANPISRTSMRSPVDDVIDKVCSMGFSREHTREVVRQLTENGQAVDMNVVLDKLMNGGDSSQNARGWFNRR